MVDVIKERIVALREPSMRRTGVGEWLRTLDTQALVDALETLSQLDDLFIQIQPAHLRQHVNCSLNDEEELEIRASLVREVLKDAD